MLRESSETAARERLRLEALTGRSRAAGILRLAPAKLRHLGSEDAARSGLRYQPVAWTAIVVAAVAFYFPGRPDSGPSAPAFASQAPSPVAAAPTTVPASAGTTTTLPVPAATFTPPPPPASRPLTGAAAAPATTTTTTTTTTVPSQAVPLSVRGFGWASSLSGSGVSSAEVPEGTMPVATRLGDLDKASFLRLAGTATALSLVEDGDGAREALGAGLVVACPITEAGWSEEPDQSLGDAPAWDAEACVAGTERDGTWVFDLSTFPDRTGQAGVALVPDAAAPPDFQITFRAG